MDAVIIGVGRYRGLSHLHQPLHARVVVAGLRAREIDLAGLGGPLDHLTSLVGLHAYLIVVGMLHLAPLHYHGVVLLELAWRAKHQLVLELTPSS